MRPYFGFCEKEKRWDVCSFFCSDHDREHLKNNQRMPTYFVSYPPPPPFLYRFFQKNKRKRNDDYYCDYYFFYCGYYCGFSFLLGTSVKNYGISFRPLRLVESRARKTDDIGMARRLIHDRKHKGFEPFLRRTSFCFLHRHGTPG